MNTKEIRFALPLWRTSHLPMIFKNPINSELKELLNYHNLHEIPWNPKALADAAYEGMIVYCVLPKADDFFAKDLNCWALDHCIIVNNED